MRGVLLALLLAASGATAVAGEPGRAKLDFQLHCMGCHGETGDGLAGKVPSFRANLARLLSSTEGREFVMRVPGVSQSALPSDRLAALLNWIVKEFGSPEAQRAPAFTAAEVERLRAKPLLEVVATRERIWNLASESGS